LASASFQGEIHMAIPGIDAAKVAQILYTNYRNETALRRIVPEQIRYGATPWHPQPQWLLDAVDLDKNERRSFALKDIKSWSTLEDEVTP
jgi:hypothetical protein